MDIRQLRAGNLVTTNGNPAGTTKGGIYKVLDTNSANRLDELGLVGDATLQILDGDYKTCVGAWVDYLEPIEITNELLKIIGFYELGNSLVFNLDKYEIYITSDYIDSYYGISVLLIYNDDGMEISKLNLQSENFYLHTLQNLIYDMIGIELNVYNLITK